MKRTWLRRFALCMSVSVFLISCRASGAVSSIKRDDLFSLKYGNFEDQLNFFDLSGTGNDIHTELEMKDGFFYISNGESKKILEMNSYGDLLSLYFNSEENPVPLFNSVKANVSSVQSGPQEVSTKKVIDYPFNSPSKICVDSKQRIYALEVLPQERQEEGNNRILRQVVLRFDGDSFIDYIGQQGPGGTPFPFVKDIYTTAKNELVVVCIVPEGLEVFWFSEAGYLLHDILINSSEAPNPFSNGTVPSFFKVDNVIPDYSDYQLFVKIDYYNTTVDETSKVQSGIDYNSTYIYPLDAVSGKYGKAVLVPPFEEAVTQGFSRQVLKSPYDFLGVTENNWMFFTVITQDGYIVQIFDPSSGRILRRLLQFDTDKVVYDSFSLSSKGIVSALLAYNDKIDIVWWRTDSLLDSLVKK